MLSSAEITMLIKGVGETLLMSLASTLFGYILGLPWGIILAITGKDGIKEQPVVYRVLDVITSIMRSIPFLIMVIFIGPLTLLIVGRSVGTEAMIVPLTVSAAPMIARMVESSIREVDGGVIEAAQAMGASTWDIIVKVMLVEGRVSLVSGATISLGTIIGYSAMAGILGGGGLGDIAMRYGYYRYQPHILYITVILIVLIMNLFQWIGTAIANHMDRR